MAERCKKCNHRMDLHHWADTKDKEVFVCEGESLPCFCIEFSGTSKEMYDRLSREFS